MSGAAVFRGLDREALDREYDNRRKIADAARLIERWYREGEVARRSMSCLLDVAYGPDERQCYDVFPAAVSAAPVLVFIHGGYWQSRDRTMMHFLAPFYVAAGVTFVSVGYRLCPDVTLGAVVADVRDAVLRIHATARDVNANPDRLFVAGHSAGGHLAALTCGPAGPGRGVVKGGCSISGLHDLEPVRLCYLNDTLHLDDEDCARYGPVEIVRSHQGRDIDLPPLLLTTGSEEGPEYLRQRDALASVLRRARQPVSIVENPGANHFTACEAFADPAHPLSEAMLRLIFSPGF